MSSVEDLYENVDKNIHFPNFDICFGFVVREISSSWDLMKLVSEIRNDEYLEVYNTTSIPEDGGLMARNLILVSYQFKIQGVYVMCFLVPDLPNNMF